MIRNTVKNNIAHIEIQAELGTPEAMMEFKEVLHNSRDCLEIQIDLSNAVYIGSAFINTLMAFCGKNKISHKRIHLLNAPQGIHNVLDLLGMNRLFSVYRTSEVLFKLSCL